MRLRWLVVTLLVSVGATGRGAAQGSLAEAAERTRQAWLLHDAQGIVGHGGSVVLQIPGADPSSPLDRSQAVELLRRHLRAAVERGLAVRALREVEPGRGYAELERRYVVAGTTDLRRETIFLAFRETGGAWALTEVRSAP